MALPPLRFVFCATWGVTFIFRHSLTKSRVSYTLSEPTVIRCPPGICSNITRPASRSAVPLAWKTSVVMMNPLRFSVNRFPL